MNVYLLYILTSLALIFVIEGLVYVLFPDMVRKLMAMAVMMPVRQLRLFGAVVAVTGFCLIWILHSLTGH